jgi:hypothetical protein
MKISSPFLLPFFLAAIFVDGVKSHTDHAGWAMAPLILSFDNVVGEQDLKPDPSTYTNAAGESFTITQLQYFISNIKLGRADGTEFIVPQDECYFLVQENVPASQRIRLMVPEAEYNRITFIVGVDSLRNTMDISKRTGVLDPASAMDNGMYWGWNSGYIFFKMEGNSTTAPADPTGRQKFRYHIGGFGGYSAPTINNIKTVSLDLDTKGVARVEKGKQAAIYIRADILKAFTGRSAISIAAHPSVMFSEYSVNIAGNYSNMFTHHRTDN